MTHMVVTYENPHALRVHIDGRDMGERNIISVIKAAANRSVGRSVWGPAPRPKLGVINGRPC